MVSWPQQVGVCPVQRAAVTRSVAAEAARRIEVGEFAEIELDNGLQGLPGGGVAQRFR